MSVAVLAFAKFGGGDPLPDGRLGILVNEMKSVCSLPHLLTPKYPKSLNDVLEIFRWRHLNRLVVSLVQIHYNAGST